MFIRLRINHVLHKSNQHSEGDFLGLIQSHRLNCSTINGEKYTGYEAPRLLFPPKFVLICVCVCVCQLKIIRKLTSDC